MTEIKPYTAKVTYAGNSNAIIIPAWISKAFDVNKGDYVVVQLKKSMGPRSFALIAQ